MRNLMLLQNSDDMESVLDVSAENLRAMKEEAGMVDNEVLMRYIRVFSDLSNQLKNSSQKRVLIEVAIIKLCRPEMEQDYSSLIDRLEQLEKKMAQGIPVAVAPSAGHNLAPAADVHGLRRAGDHPGPSLELQPAVVRRFHHHPRFPPR